jgi:hypothetical protein
MSQTIGYITLVVRDYGEAIAFFTQPWASTSSKTLPPKTATVVTNAGSWSRRAAPEGQPSC